MTIVPKFYLFLALAFAASSTDWFYEHTIERKRIELFQVDPTRISQLTDSFWRKLALALTHQIEREWKPILSQLLTEQKILTQLKALPNSLDEASSGKPEDFATQAHYCSLPEVLVDWQHGAIFPMPLQAPTRLSWYHAARRASAIMKALMRETELLDSNAKLSAATRKDRFLEASRLYEKAQREFAQLAQEERYLEAWIPQLEAEWEKALARSQIPSSYAIARFSSMSAGSQSAARQELRPHRIMKRTFLPDKLGGVVTLPIQTDISDIRFLREVEGALDTYWNQSKWADHHETHFRIRWEHIPKNTKFAAGQSTLQEHLRNFKKESAGMTTGGLTTHVKGQVLVFGPGKINPRTLAHELGHLMGFEDCYFRTLSSQGVFGLAVFEWNNPVFPDDLMCDNSVGVPRAEVW